MTDPLLTIGAFARAAGLSPGALRHYDEVGLLPPADIDAATGYRYYTPDLIRRAGLIARMREIELPIEAMRVVLDGPLDTARATLHEFVTGQAERTARAERAVTDILTAAAAGRAEPTPARLRVVGPEVAAAIRQVRAAAEADPRSSLGSVLLDVAGGRLDVVATNRYWMAARTLRPLDGTGTVRAVLALDDADRLSAHLDSAVRTDSELTLAIGAERVAVCADTEASVPTRPVDYPAHRALIAGLPTPVVRAVAPRVQLAEAVQAAGRAEIDLVFARGTLAVAPPGEDGVSIPAIVGPADLTVRLGSALISRALTSAVGPEVMIAASTFDRPVRLEAPHQPDYLALVMPIRPR